MRRPRFFVTTPFTMFGLASARGVAAIRAGSRLSPQTIAYLHSASITPLTIAAAPKLRIVSVAVGQLGLRGYATQQNGSSGGSGGSGSGSSGSSGGKHESKEELLNRLTREARQRGRAFDQTHDHVGPFPLGVGPSGRTKTWKPWGDLNLGGKRECTGAEAVRPGEHLGLHLRAVRGRSYMC